jgi:hypothetical protein
MVEDRNGCITISVVYSPPKHIIERKHYITFFKTLGNRCIAAGNNIKHTYWGSRLILPKGRELFKAIEDMNLVILSTEDLVYWPSDNKKTPDLLDFSIIRDILKDFCRSESCLVLSSDHSLIIFTINNKIMTKSKLCTLCKTKWPNAKTKWPYFQDFLNNFILLKTDDDIVRAIESFNNAVQQTAWSQCRLAAIQISISNIYLQQKKN